MYSWAAKSLELYFLFLSMTDQHSCVWCIISKPAVHCCSVPDSWRALRCCTLQSNCAPRVKHFEIVDAVC